MMMRSESGEHGIHGAPDGTVGFSVGSRGADPEAESYALPDQIQAAIEREKDVADLEPYHTHESDLQDGDAEARAYMEVWDWYQCAWNAVQHRRLADKVQDQLDRAIDSIMGGPLPSDAPGEMSFEGLLWLVGQERARLLTLADHAKLHETRMECKLEDTYAHVEQLRVLAEWIGVNPIPTDPVEISAAIRDAVVKQRNAR